MIYIAFEISSITGKYYILKVHVMYGLFGSA